MTKKKTTKPTHDQPETVAEFKAFGMTHRIIIYFRNEAWQATYQRNVLDEAGHGQAAIQAETKAELLTSIKRFMYGHSEVIVRNLIEDIRAA